MMVKSSVASSGKDRSSRPTKRVTNAKPKTNKANGGVVICTVTLSDIKKARSAPESQKQRQLVRIPSKAERLKLYEESARAIEWREAQALPSQGGRPWRCRVKVVDTAPLTSSASGKGSGATQRKEKKGTHKGKNKKCSGPLFRWFRGKLELACLPHILEKIPEMLAVLPAKSRRRKDDDSDDEDDDEEAAYSAPKTSLSERSISCLSTLAWNDPKHPIPVIERKWVSPDSQTFTSRKSAMEHAAELVRRDKLIDRILHGLGSRGVKLRPFKPTKKDALEAGLYRFWRDGLWVVGQEEDWQDQRVDEMIRKEKRRKRKSLEKAGNIVANAGAFCVDVNVADAGSKCVDVEAAAESTSAVGTQQEPEEKESLSNKEDLWKKQKPAFDFFILKKREEILNRTSEEANSVDRNEILLPSPAAGDELIRQWNALSTEDKNEWAARARSSEVKTVEEREQHHSAANEEKKPEIEVQGGGDVVVVTASDSGTDLSSDSEGSGGVNAPVPAESSTQGAAVASALVTVPAEDTVRLDSSSDSEVCGSVNAPVSDGSCTQYEVVASPPETVPSENTAQPITMCEGESRTVLVSPSPDLVADAGKDKSESDPPGQSEKKGDGESAPLQSSPPSVKRQRSPSRPRRIAPSSHWRLSPQQIELCYSAALEHYDKVMYTVKARALYSELADGFDVLRERGRGRFDMELDVFDSPTFDFLTDLNKAKWMPIVRKILGEDVVLIHKGAFLSLPGSEAQVYHQDGPHLTTKYQRPCHAVNVFIPLVDLHSRNGPTEFCLGTHYLGYEGYAKEMVETPHVRAGTPVIFDYRLGHRGMGNSSSSCRPIVYCTYAASSGGKEFRDSVNFSRKRYRRIGDLVERPLSREERAQKRKKASEDHFS